MILGPLFQLGNLVTRALPAELRYRVASGTGRLLFYLMPRRRRIAYENYGQVLGLPWNHPKTKQTARRAFSNYAKMISDFILMGSLSPAQIRAMVRPSGAEILDRALAQGKGVIVVTAHFSNWDILAAAAAVYGYAVNAVTGELRGGLNRLVVRSRERIGMRMIPVGAARGILRALQRNELVALVCDLYRGENGVSVDFFDRPTILPSGPAALALKTGAPIIPVWVERLPDNGYLARVEAPLEVVRSGDLTADIEATTHRIAAFFERIIRHQPDQWFVFLPLWRQQNVAASTMQTALGPS